MSNPFNCTSFAPNRFDVWVVDFNRDASPPAREYFVRNVLLVKARRVERRSLRRGLKLFGGAIERANWGGTAGTMTAYRSVSICNAKG